MRFRNSLGIWRKCISFLRTGYDSNERLFVGRLADTVRDLGPNDQDPAQQSRQSLKVEDLGHGGSRYMGESTLSCFTGEIVLSTSKGSVALLGDACHPSVPYLAQGAAQAVEDAVVLGRLLGRFSRTKEPESSLPRLLELYQAIRKSRAVPIVRAADSTRDVFHCPDGPEQRERDRLLREHDWWDEDRTAPWLLADFKTLHGIYGYDAVKSADEGFGGSRLGKHS